MLDTSLYFITNSNGFSQDEFLKRVEYALIGGVTLLQLREKEKSVCDYIKMAEKVHSLSKKYGVPLIIDDNVDVAIAVGAEGVHLGRDDMPIDKARSILGNGKIIGATAKTVETAVDAYKMGADYLGVGAIFPTKTKVKTILTPIETLDAICNAVPIPVNAIGGLTSENIDVLKEISISGVCVVSAIMDAENSRMATEKLKIAIGGILK